MSNPNAVHNGNKVYRYDMFYRISEGDLLTYSREFYVLLDEFTINLKELGHDFELLVDTDKLYETIIRTDQRKLHYKMYHKDTDINELKQAAATCYWLLKYRVIVAINDGKISTLSSQMMSIFCLRFVIFTVNRYRYIICESNGSEFKPIAIPKTLQRDLIYAFDNRDFNYDSLTLLIECLAN